MRNLNGLRPEELEDLYLEVIELRKKVLETCDQYGYSASQLVSRHFENEIENFYGKKLLKTKVKGNSGLVCKDMGNKGKEL